MNKEMICKNCKYHYIEEICFDYPQSCCFKRQCTTEKWCKCYDFEYSDRYIEQLQQENKILKENAENNDKVVDKVNWKNMLLKKENEQLKDKLSKIETLIINHNCDTGDIYYKYNSKFLKSELKQRILEIVYMEKK